MLDRRGRVGAEPVVGRLADVRLPVEARPAVADAGRPPEVVDRDRLDAVLGEPQREVPVVGVQAADIGQDHDPGAGRLRGPGEVAREPVAVGGLERDVPGVERAALDRGDRRAGVVVEAHRSVSGVGSADPVIVARGDGSVRERGRLVPSRRPGEARSGPSARMRAMPSPLVVMKFGGSSVAGAERIKRVARRIVRERANGSQLVVVVSAMGDTTDELLALAAAITDDPDPRELDVLLATGEHQSATLMSMALQSLGVPAISLTGPQAGITTDGRYGKARIAGIDPRRVRAELAPDKVVIVAGFQGMSVAALAGMDASPTASDVHAAEITTLGRGGSDTTAVALAAQLQGGPLPDLSRT